MEVAAAVNVLKKTPPSDLIQNLTSLSTLIESNPSAVDALMKAVPLPFGTHVPSEEEIAAGERPFLQCHYNFDGMISFQSPWTNEYYPKPENASSSSSNNNNTTDAELAHMQVAFNEVWDAYRQLYYGKDAVGSVFLKNAKPQPQQQYGKKPSSASSSSNNNNNNPHFEGLFGIQKNGSEGSSWSSVHLVQVDHPHVDSTGTLGAGSAMVVTYTIESTVLLTLQPATHTNVSAYLTKKTVKSLQVHTDHHRLVSSHIENLGKTMEEVEIELRSNLDRVHLPKTQEVVETIRKRNRKTGSTTATGGIPTGGRPLGLVMDAAFFQKQAKMVEAFQNSKLKK